MMDKIYKFCQDAGEEFDGWTFSTIEFKTISGKKFALNLNDEGYIMSIYPIK